jgi:hypothetical protein
MPMARWFSTLLVVLSCLVAAVAALAQPGGSNTYTVDGVDVDVTAADAIQARQQAMREAQRRAIRTLAERLVAPEDRAKIPPVDDAQLDRMIRGIEFARERTLANRYIATLNVVFNADAVKGWLAGSGTGISETVTRAALLVPLWKGQVGVEPLDDRNPWREAWTSLDTTGSAVPLTVVRGDQPDRNALTVEEAYVGDISALARLNQRYRAPTIVVAIAEGNKASGPITVYGLRYDTQTGARSEIARTTVPDAGQLADAARKMHARLDEEWRGVATVRRDSQDALNVYVPIRALSDWVQVRQRLGGVPAIKSVTVRSLESDRAELRLEYFGTTEQLQRVLAQAGLQLDRDAEQWRLQTR